MHGVVRTIRVTGYGGPVMTRQDASSDEILQRRHTLGWGDPQVQTKDPARQGQRHGIGHGAVHSSGGTTIPNRSTIVVMACHVEPPLSRKCSNPAHEDE